MTETIVLESTKSVILAKKELESKLNVSLKITGKRVDIEGPEFNEYVALTVLEAMNFSFPLKEALLLTNEGYIFRKINIKDFTRRKNLDEVRARLIGTEGKTKRAIEEISGCVLVIKDKIVGIIGLTESIKDATTAITRLIMGAKQANVYSYLERMNREKKEKIDLGLKPVKEPDPKPEDKKKKIKQEEQDSQ